jgi:hypothetical protein
MHTKVVFRQLEDKCITAYVDLLVIAVTDVSYKLFFRYKTQESLFFVLFQ